MEIATDFTPATAKNVIRRLHTTIKTMDVENARLRRALRLAQMEIDDLKTYRMEGKEGE